MNIQRWFPVGLAGLISLLSKGLSRVFSSTTIRKHQFFSTQPSLWSHAGKTIALTRWTFVGKMMSLLFNMLSRFVITFFNGASCGFVILIYGLYYVEVCFLCAHFLKTFIINGCWILSKTLSAPIKMIIWFSFLNLLMWIGLWSVDMEKSVQTWGKSHLIMVNG